MIAMETEFTVRKIKTEDSIAAKIILIAVSIIFLTVFLLLPLYTVFQQAFSEGISVYISSLTNEDSLSAIKLSLTAAFISVTINLLFAVSISWVITKFTFRGKSFLLTLLDIPFTISPVISGMMFVLFLGSQSFLGNLFKQINVDIIFAVPGIVLVTMFVTFPYIARELIPQMFELGKEEEEAARMLGAGGLKIFFKITLPNIKWSLFYGLILCNARAMGEFGAVSVVSGHIRNLTNTMPLHIEILYNEYNFSASFAVASLLTLLALFTLILKIIIEWINKRKVKMGLEVD